MEEKDAQSKIEEASKKYLQSDKGKQAIKKYQSSDKGKKARERYLNSDKGQIASLKYYNSEKGKETRQTRNITRRVMVECQEWLHSHPEKSSQDFLREKGYA